MDRRDFLYSTSLGALAAIGLGKHTWSAYSEDKPNIVFVMADDLGYGDLQCFNNASKIPTPNCNQMAKEGVTFTDAHSSSAVCTPTRYSVLTGQYCWRTRLKRGVQNGYGPSLIDPMRMTAASLLKNAGYNTACVGKWHLGLDFAWLNKEKLLIDTDKPVENNPTVYGFDYSYIIPASLDFPPYGYIENDRFVKPLSEQQEKLSFPKFLREGPRGEKFIFEKSMDELTAKAVGYIHENAKKSNPFFLYFPLTAPHKPVIPEERFKGSTTLGPYGDFVSQVDWTIGQIRKAINDAGVKKNTLLIVTSDNGSYMYRLSDDKVDHVNDKTVQGYRESNHTANHVFRGTKADIWEAGHHVPFLVEWGNKLQGGTKIKSTICLTDFFATCAEITGQTIPENAGEDSFSFAPLLSPTRKLTVRPPVVHHSGNGMFAIRQGDYKLVLGNGSGGRENPRGKPFEKPYHLYNLQKDSSETKNIAASSRKDEQLEAVMKTFINEGRSVPIKQW